MNSGNKIKKNAAWVLALALAFSLTLGSGQFIGRAKASPTPWGPLTLSVQASQGTAVPGNAGHAYFLIFVNDQAGLCVAGLKQTDFNIGAEFLPPSAAFGFGNNNIVSFFNNGGGMYKIEVALAGGIWEEGDYLVGLSLLCNAGQGAEAVKLSVKCPTYCLRADPGTK